MFGIRELRRLREQRETLQAEASRVLEAAAAREGEQRALTEAEATRVRAIRGEVAGLNSLIVEAEEHIDQIREAVERSQARARQRQMSASDAAPPVNAGEDRPFGKFRNFGDYAAALAATACASAGRPRIDGAEVRADERILELEAATGRVSSDVPQEGNILASLQYSGVLMSRAWQLGDIRNRVTVQEVGDGFDGTWMPYIDETDRAKGKRYGGVTVYWAEDGLPVDKAKVTGVQPMEIRVKELRALVRVPEKMLRDATALGSYLLRAIPEEYTYQLEDGIVNRAGNGKMLGVHNSPVFLAVAKEKNQPNHTITAQNLIDAYARFKPRDRSKSGFFFNQESLPQLQTMQIPIGTSGQLLYMPPQGLSTAPYGTIFGLPCIPIEYAKGLGQVGDCGFYDFSDYLLVVKAGGLQMASSAHFYFDTHDMGFRFEQSLNGQPFLSGPIKPENATDPNFRLSPFVGIAKRAA
ncbi:MAG: phage major capsid protein [Vicinamibacteria bacterium]|nr:phage major capsid protein [Vicinamibacteria bacterium]